MPASQKTLTWRKHESTTKARDRKKTVARQAFRKISLAAGEGVGQGGGF